VLTSFVNSVVRPSRYAPETLRSSIQALAGIKAAMGSHYCRRKVADMHLQVRIDGRRMIPKRSIRESAAPEFYK